MNMEIINGLKKARDLILDPKNWKNTAPTLEERNTGHNCALTALWEADSVPKINYLKMNEYLYRSMKEIDNLNKPSFGISSWNDSHTHEQVITAFDKAIALAKIDFESKKE